MSKINSRIKKLENTREVDSVTCIDCAALAAEIYASLPIFQDTVISTEDAKDDVDDQKKDG